MQTDYQIVTREIPAKGKGYLIIRKCPPAELDGLLYRGMGELLEQGAVCIYAASADPGAPLSEGTGGGYELVFRHALLDMERALDGGRPLPAGRLALEPLCRERGEAWLDLYHGCFFDVPNSATYDREDLERMLTDRYRGGFALRAGVPVGFYELNLEGEIPEIAAIGLQREARGKGLGRELLLAVMELLAELGYCRCGLMVSDQNAAAYALYQAVGFDVAAVRSRWYQVFPREK